MYVSAFDLEDYPVRAEDVLHTGVEAFEAALNTINVGKFNLGFCSIGMAEHCFYETIDQAEDRVLFGKRVTEFGQVRRILSEAYARLLAAKLYGARAVDYVRTASREDRRYLLYTPITKMQVTTEGERIVRLLAEVISAKGFERDSYFESAKNIVDGLPKLEGTVHVNRALTLKFLPELPVRAARRSTRRPRAHDAGDDAFLFAQGPTRGLGQITFPDWRPAFDAFAEVPNVARFREQADALVALLQDAPLTPEQMTGDLDFQQSLAQLFTLIPYAPADPRAGPARRHPARRRRPRLRDARPRLQRHRDRAARQGLVHRAPSRRGRSAASASPSSTRPRSTAIYAEVRALAGATSCPSPLLQHERQRQGDEQDALRAVHRDADDRAAVALRG